MQIYAEKRYNLPAHSYMLLLCATDNAGDPLDVFVVQRLHAPSVSSSGSSSSSASSESSTEGSSGDSVSSAASSSSNVAPVYEDDPICTPTPDIVLIAVASPEDMLYTATWAEDTSTLFRRSSVSLMFRSRPALQKALGVLLTDLKILSKVLGLGPVVLAEHTLYDSAETVPDNVVFWMVDV